MSLQKIKYVFEHLTEDPDWSVQLLRICTGERMPVAYASRSISLSPETAMGEFVGEIQNYYLKGKNNKLGTYSQVRDYDGTTEGTVIYRIGSAHPLIQEAYQALLQEIAAPQEEGDPVEFNPTAYMLQGEVRLPGTMLGEPETESRLAGVRLFSMQKPVSVLKNRFIYSRGIYRKISGSVLNLRSVVDVMVIDGMVYFFSMTEGERLFHMERTYRMICTSKITELEEMGILTDAEAFRAVALKGHNPRKFASFHQDYLERLAALEERRRIAEYFGIPMVGERFDTTTEEASDKIVKVLCQKGMRDAFYDQPMEVSGARRWRV